MKTPHCTPGRCRCPLRQVNSRTGTDTSAGKPSRSWTGQITSARPDLQTVVHRRVHPGPVSSRAAAALSTAYGTTRSSKVQLCDRIGPESTIGVRIDASMLPAQPARAAFYATSHENTAGESADRYPARHPEHSAPPTHVLNRHLKDSVSSALPVPRAQDCINVQRYV